MRTTTSAVGADSSPDFTANPGDGPFLTTKAAGEHLSLSPRTLEKHRVTGTGPRYRKHGGKVVYRLEDLDDWSARGTRASTSDPGHPNAPKPFRHGLPLGRKKLSGAKK
ncbi:MAG: helix-turn-helix domain-containing protein [Azospirillum sp.]|nr:helix-turn-helix domain-containing protein [Azospirillum sp.]